MQVSVETTQGLERRMTVSVPAERIDSEVESRLRNLSRTARIKGFRPGKVPLKVIESRYGPMVRQEVVNEITRDTFFEAINQENLQLAGMPRFMPRVMEAGQDFEYEALFEVMAQFELAPLDYVEIVRPVAEITERDIDNMLETLRQQRGSWREIDQPAAEGHQVVADFTGTIDGEEFPGNRGERVPVLLGAKRLIPEVEQGFYGLSPGEERSVEVRFSDDYHVREVAGKQAVFRLKVHSVSELQLPEIDEAFIRSYDVAEGTIEAMRAELRKTMNDEMQDAMREKLKRQALDALYRENSKIEAPRSQVEAQTEALMAQAREMLMRKGTPEAEITLDRAPFEEQARRRVVLGMLIREIVRQQGLKADPQQIRARVEFIASSYENTDEAIRWYYSDRERLGNIEQLVLEDQVVDWVVSRVRLREEPTTFEALLKERRGR
jgi:trigger factor